ncbi:MAG: hypothetical protein AAGI24_17450 [Pseudomonadota bacterium]
MEDHKRKHWLINPAFQLRFMAYMSLASLISISVFYFANTIYFDAVYAMGHELGLDPDHPYFSFIEDQQTLLLRIFVLLSLVAFTLLMGFSLLLSHRIAGPIYRIERYMEAVAQGSTNIQPVHLRQGDFFPEIASIVNATIKELRHREEFEGVDEDGKRPAYGLNTL